MADEPQAFWAWFTANADRYRDVEVPEKDQLLDELESRLHRYHPRLYFEVGGMPAGPRELVITAEGDASLFPTVERLVAAAPQIAGWEAVALKQPGGFDFVINYGRFRIEPDTCWFQALVSKSDPRRLGVRVACPNFSLEAEKTFLSAIYILLDSGLGERVASLEIAYVEVAAVPPDPEAEGYAPLPGLPDYLASRRERDGA
jgi:hypothetical protein